MALTDAQLSDLLNGARKTALKVLNYNGGAGGITDPTDTATTTTGTGGGVGKGDSVGTGTGMGTGAGVNTGSAAITDPNLSKAQSYTDALANAEKTPFTYDTATDPAYAAIQSENMKNSALANRDMQEDMNSRGILNSTVTSDRSTQIYKQGSDATTAAIPQLEAQAYARHQQDIANQQGLISAYTGLSNTANDRAAQQATMTGRMPIPAGAQPIIDQIIADKQKWGSTSGAERTAVEQDAIAQRSQLAKYGIDPSLFGSNVSIDQALENEGNGAGIMTVAYQKMLADAALGVGDRYATMPTGVGSALSALPDFSDLGGVIDSLKGVPNANYLINSMKNMIAQQRADAATKTADARMISADKAGAGNAISAAHLTLDQQNAQNAQNEKDAKAAALQATNKETAAALDKQTRADAYQYVIDHKDSMIQDGVDISGIIKEISTTNKPSWGSVTGTTNPLYP